MPGKNRYYKRKLYFTTEDRIFLHLLGFAGREGEVNQPDALTQFGIADAIGLGRSTVSKGIQRLSDAGLVAGHRAHVPSGALRRTVYFLTEAGVSKATHRRLEIEEEVIAFRAGDGTEGRLRVAQIPKLLPEYATLLDVATHVSEGAFDAATFVSPHRQRFVDMTERLPHLRYFFGRDAELAAMDAWLASPAERALIVTGIAGIGKTTLLARKAEDWRGTHHLFFCRIMEWTTLQGVIRQLGEFLVRLSRKGLAQYLDAQAGVEPGSSPPAVQVDIEQVASILAADLRGVPAVLLFDDYQNAPPPIRDFFYALRAALEPVEGPKLVVAGRGVAPFYDRREVRVKGVVRELPLEGLDPESCEKLLLARNLVLDSETRQALCRQSAGHPLFLELADSAAALEGGDVHRYLEEELFARITDVEAKVLTVASVFRYPVRIDALFIDDSVEPATIRGLADQSLIREVSARVYDVHDVVRSFFLSMMTPRDRRRYHRWAAQYYMSQMSPDPLEALHHFVEAEDPTSAARVAVHEGRAILVSGRSEELLRLLERLLPGLQEPAQSAELHLLKAQVLSIRGEPDAAAALYREILALPPDPALQPKIAEANRALGDLLRRQEAMEPAEQHLEAALRLYRSLGDSEGQAETFLALGSLAESMSDTGRAEHHYQKAVALAQTLGKKALEAKLHLAFARLLEQRGDPSGALTRKEQALGLAEGLADWHLQAWVLVSLGTSLQGLERIPECLSAYQRGIETARRIGDLRMLAYGLWNAAGAYTTLDDLQRAETSLKEAEGIFRKLREPVMEALVLQAYGHVWEKRGKWPLAKHNLVAAMELLRQGPSAADFARYATVTAHLHFRNGDREGAIRLLREAVAVARRLRLGAVLEEAEKSLDEYSRTATPAQPTSAARDGIPTA